MKGIIAEAKVNDKRPSAGLALKKCKTVTGITVECYLVMLEARSISFAFDNGYEQARSRFLGIVKV